MNTLFATLTSNSDGASLLLIVTVFIATVAAVYAIGNWLFAVRLPGQRRLESLTAVSDSSLNEWQESSALTLRFVEPAAKVLMPQDDWRRSHLKFRLARAGFRDSGALYRFLGAKLILAMAFPVLVLIPLLVTGLFVLHALACMAALCVAALIGYFTPNLFIMHTIETRQLAVSEAFPDALDMLVVCVEAGLSLDAAIQRVGKEFKHSQPILSDELELVSLELRAGRPRDEALRSLADRTGVEDIQTVTSILVQAQKFGTSIANSLREQANDLRIVRMQRAREKAAKLPVKLIFPIVTFIFPAMYVVILGPAFIRIYTAILGGGH